MIPFTVTREDQGCSGHMDTIPAGETAFTDAGGWVWCAVAAAQVAAGPDASVFTEVTIGWGEDTRCPVCLCDLPAGAPAWSDSDDRLCADCAAAEGA